MGAGMSGLACAIVLEHNGIYPDIYESRSRVGDRFINAEALLNVLNRPINNAPDFFSKKYGIQLKPLASIKHITFFSKNSRGMLTGNLGWSNIRGRHDESYESQLAAQVKSKIIFNSKHTYDELSKEYSHVVLATGDGAYAEKLGNYITDLTLTAKGATVEGHFDAQHICSWLNYDFVPKGYAYLIPFSASEAHLVIGFPEYPGNIKRSVQDYWETFYQTACRDLNQDLHITDNFEVNGYMVGRSIKPKIDNTYYTGNCFGSLTPAFAFGQFMSILTGVYAAQDICGIGDYETEAKQLYKVYENSLVLRRYMEGLDNDKLDRYVQMFNLSLVNMFFGSRVKTDIFKLLSYLARTSVKNKRA